MAKVSLPGTYWISASKIPEHEAALATSDADSRSAALLIRDNYEFTDLGQSVLNGHTYYLLGLSPKRKQKQLILGRAWVNQSSFRVRRVEGKLAKSPSWLLKNVYVKLEFAERSGNSVQSAMEATADVRFIGTQILRAQMLDYRPTNSPELKSALTWADRTLPDFPSLHTKSSIPELFVHIRPPSS